VLLRQNKKEAGTSSLFHLLYGPKWVILPSDNCIILLLYRGTMQRLIFLLSFYVASFINSNAQSDCACCGEKARQFDFWLGTWNVSTPDGKLAGTNTIELIQDSCVLRENWTSSKSDFTGTSYNFYNKVTEKWQQTWVDNKGGNLLLEGEYVNGKMILSSKPVRNANGKMQVDRITWTNNTDKTIRQYWEASTDNGVTWKTVFDGLYKRKQ
jgi:hypothetical protein